MLNGCRRVTAAVAGLVLVTAVVAGCGGDGSESTPSPSPEPTTATPTPDASPTPTPPEPEVVPPSVPEFARGAEGQEDFARYVVLAWTYALTANDAAPLLDVSLGERPCSGCRELARTLEQRAEEGWSVFPFEPRIDTIRLDRADGSVIARVSFDLPETQSYFEDGRLRNTNEAREGRRFTIAMRAIDKAYRLVAFSIR